MLRETTDILRQKELMIGIEESLLGALISDFPAYSRLPLAFTREWFFLSSHQIIFSSIECLVKNGDSDKWTLLGLSLDLADKKQLNDIGGTGALGKLLSRAFGSESVEYYAKLLLGYHTKRQLVRLANNILKKSEEQGEKVSEVVQYAQDQFFNIAQQVKPSRLWTTSDSIAAWQDSLEEEKESRFQGGLQSSLSDLHKYVLGFKSNHFIVIGARPSVGKTSLAINFARDFLKKGVPVAFVSFEMDKVELVTKLMSCYFDVPLSRCTSGEFGPKEQEKVGGGLSAFSELPFYVYDGGVINVAQIKLELQQEALRNGVEWGAVFVDYIQLMSRSVEYSTQEMGSIAQQLKELARSFCCPVFGISQLNRASTSTANKKPSLSDLRQSGAIEQAADVVILLHRDDAAFPEREPDGMADVIVAKNRHGMAGAMKVRFKGITTSFLGIHNYYDDIGF